MDISRRSFLRGALAVSAVCVMPLPALAVYPTLYGDGEHDDTEALNAMLSGKPVICEGRLIEHKDGEPVHFRGGIYRIAAPIRVENRDVSIDGVRLVGDKSFQGDHVMYLARGNFSFRNVHFDMREAPGFGAANGHGLETIYL